jgi:hypothetical protein
MLHAQTTTFADLPPAAAEWQHGLLTLRADRSPCPRLGSAAWATMLEAALDFVERYGVSAGVEYSLIVGIENSLVGALARGGGTCPAPSGLSILSHHARRRVLRQAQDEVGRERRGWSCWEKSS